MQEREKEGQEAEMNEPMIRTLNLDLPMTVSNYEETEEGLFVRNVKLLAEGTWTDSAIKTPLYYPAHILEKYAANWADNTFWARHSGGQPRNVVTDQLGEVLNQHYDPVEKAIMGDVFYDYSTTTGRDGGKKALRAAKKGRPPAVSVEWGGVEAYDPEMRRYEAKEMTFIGLAQVTRGACSKCKLPKAMSAEEREREVKKLEKAELDKALTDFGAALKAEILVELDKKLAAQPAPDVAQAVSAAMSAYEERLKQLEMEPMPKSVVKKENKELEAPVGPHVVVRGGKIMME